MTSTAMQRALDPGSESLRGVAIPPAVQQATLPIAPGADLAFAYQLMEMLAIPVFVLDSHAHVLIWNRACERLTGVPANEIVGTDHHSRCFYDQPRPTLADLVIQDRLDEIRHIYPRHGRPGASSSPLSVENWCDMPRAGKRRYLAADASPIFDDTLAAEWARAQRQTQPISLLMVDVDNFKAYNDANGHLGGDECLKRIATAVASEMRANDLVARYGGEEFAVILPNQSLKGAAIVAERIRRRVECLQLPNGGAPSRRVTVSIGAATAIVGADNCASDLVATADAALYRAKHLGRNRISLPLAEGG